MRGLSGGAWRNRRQGAFCSFRVVWLVVWCLVIPVAPGSAFGGEMKAPKAPVSCTRSAARAEKPEAARATSSVKLAALGAIRFYQRMISPVGGTNKCGFSPSCSAYAYGAIQEQGPLVGLLMAADRLTRCNRWKSPGPDYTLLPNGRLFDPLSKNLLSGSP